MSPLLLWLTLWVRVFPFSSALTSMKFLLLIRILIFFWRQWDLNLSTFQFNTWWIRPQDQRVMQNWVSVCFYSRFIQKFLFRDISWDSTINSHHHQQPSSSTARKERQKRPIFRECTKWPKRRFLVQSCVKDCNWSLHIYLPTCKTGFKHKRWF